MFRRLKLEFWKSIHRLPLGLIQLWQLYSLQRLIRHAYANTALYRDLWDKHGVKLSQFKQLSDLERFPIINKKVFLAAPIESYVGMIRPQFFIWRSTSGTSGEPFRFISINHVDSPFYHFLTYRFLYWQGLTPEKIREMQIVKTADSSTSLYPQQRSRLSLPISDFVLHTEETVQKLIRLKPDIIEAYPSILVKLVQSVAALAPDQRIKVSYAVSYGENLNGNQRQLIEDTLDCEIYDRYGLSEFGVIGSECIQHRGFHSNVESFILEIVDDIGHAVANGEKGRIIITDLRNHAMPYIRYDTGDQGYLLPGYCLCGLEGERFVFEGRIGEFLTLGPKKIHHIEIRLVLENFSNVVIQYQMIKLNDYAAKLLLIPGPAMTELSLEQIRDRIQALIGEDYHLDIELVTEIKRTPRGKCQTLINL